MNSPGEALPTFPIPTHSENGEIPGTLPWATIQEVIKDIPFEGWPNHFPSLMKKMPLPTKLRQQAYTVTCKDGNGACHPDGRKYTICEYQLLQGFPLRHRFAKSLGSGVKLRQIGNAFPPLFVKRLVRHIRKQLQKSDGLQISIDEDDFMSTEELREQEIAQFLLDNENMPEESRETIRCIDAMDCLDEDDLDMEELIAKEEEEEVDSARRWGWITAPTRQFPTSSSRSGSSSSSLSPQNHMASMEESLIDQQLGISDSPDGQSSPPTESPTSSNNSELDKLPDFPNYQPMFFHPSPFRSKAATLPFRPSISAQSVRKHKLPDRDEYRAASMPIRRRRSYRSRNPSPDIENSIHSNTDELGGSMENAIELD